MALGPEAGKGGGTKGARACHPRECTKCTASAAREQRLHMRMHAHTCTRAHASSARPAPAAQRLQASSATRPRDEPAHEAQHTPFIPHPRLARSRAIQRALLARRDRAIGLQAGGVAAAFGLTRARTGEALPPTTDTLCIRPCTRYRLRFTDYLPAGRKSPKRAPPTWHPDLLPPPLYSPTNLLENDIKRERRGRGKGERTP